MPDDKLKRISNLLNQLQVRTALESTNMSPQYLQTEIARRDAQKLENAGNKIDPVTKKPYKYSEKWLQSTGQQVPGLDSEGTSAINALDLIGTGQLAKVGINLAKDLPLKTVGRVTTNLINPSSGYGAQFQQAMQLIKDEPLKVLKAIVKDTPTYQYKAPMMSPTQYAAFRNLFKLPISKSVLKEYPGLDKAFIKTASKRGDILTPNIKNQYGKAFMDELQFHTLEKSIGGEARHSMMQLYKDKFIKPGNKSYHFFGDNWDFALHPDEKLGLQTYLDELNAGIDLNKKHIIPQLIKNQFSRDKAKVTFTDLFNNDVLSGGYGIGNYGSDLKGSLMRAMVDKHLNPTTIAGVRPVSDTFVAKFNTLAKKIRTSDSGQAGKEIQHLWRKMQSDPYESLTPKQQKLIRDIDYKADGIVKGMNRMRATGNEPTEAMIEAVYKMDTIKRRVLNSKVKALVDKQPLAPFDWILNKEIPK